MKPQKSEYEKQVEYESICNVCNGEMDLIKTKPKKNHWDKYHEYYVCPVCGYRNRKRTLNEILRDVGERE